MSRKNFWQGLLPVALMIALACWTIESVAQAGPPGRVNFQGMARDAGGTALDGPVSMVFRFYDDPAAGTILWEETYDPGVHPPAVAVSAGLFTVALGDTAHRSAGSEASFQDVFANHGALYLGVQVGEDSEMTPRISVVSAPFAVNSGALDGKEADDFAEAVHTHPGSQITGAVANAADADKLDGLDSTAFAGSAHTHAASDVISGTLTAGRGGTGLSGPGAAGNLLTSDGSGWTSSAPPSAASTGAVVDAANASLNRSGSGTAGDPYELSLNLASPNGWLGAQTFYADTHFPGTGIWTSGGRVGIGTASPTVSLEVNSPGATAIKSSGNNGIEARGSTFGGSFSNTTANTTVDLATNSYGIFATGLDAGGGFYNSGSTSWAELAYDDQSIIAGIVAVGNQMGGLFQDMHDSGLANIAYGHRGILATGNEAGGRFEDRDEHGYAYVGHGKRGISAYGADEGGYFKDTDGTSEGYVARTNSGVSCYGAYRGGYFEDMDNSAIAHVAYNDTGIDAVGSLKGGHFADTDSGNYADVGYSSYKIFGTGTPSFVQNHPTEKDRVVVYAAMEGDEVATFTRGTAKLARGAARVRLGETFAWVTNPDIGLTAHLTPKGDCQGLYIDSISTTEMVVRELGVGKSDAAFDYIVCGLRIGFEESSVVQEKHQESFIPSFADHRERYARYPELRAFNSIERFKAMEAATRGVAPEAMDFSRARALKEAIHEYDPAFDAPVGERLEEADARLSAAGTYAPGVTSRESAIAPTPGQPADVEGIVPMSITSRHANAIQEHLHADTTSPVFHPRSIVAATFLPVLEPAKEGDVIVTDPANPSLFRLGQAVGDPGVVGVAGEAGRVLPEDLADRGQSVSEEVSVVTGGVAMCRADASYGPIHTNDLLVTSPTPGHAQKAQADLVGEIPIYASGTILGKALEPLEGGTGLIRILVMLR